MKAKHIITFPTEKIQQPLTYTLVKEFDLKVNILNAYINSGEEGNLALEIEGNNSNLKNALSYISENGLKIIRSDRKLHFNSSECVACGACTAVCYPGALNLTNDGFDLEFDKSKCTLCELCTTACPFGLFKIDFIQ